MLRWRIFDHFKSLGGEVEAFFVSKLQLLIQNE